MKAFRLSSFAELDPDSGEPTLEVNFDAGRPDSPGAGEGTASWTTILTGRNGGGKSRTLRAVTSLLAGSVKVAFELEERESSGRFATRLAILNT